LNKEDKLNNGIDEYSTYPDAKFDALTKIIDEVVSKNRKKIIVFALFKNTLKYLAIRLRKSGFAPVTIHGNIKDKNEIIKDFRTNDSINVLLSSEVGSEGLDFQFCDALVNYDLPWNPMIVEQRIGRIDRFGQKSSIVNIYNLIVKDSIQEEIFDRLLNRIGIFRSCIGDLEAILDKETESGTLQQRIVRLEKELYCTELTEDELSKKIENIRKAILIEQQNLEQISEGLTDTLTNDIYFRNEIEKIQKNYRYITEQEICSFVLSLIRNYLTECSLKNIGDGKYKFHIPLSNRTCLINFLNQYQPISIGTEAELLFRHFINTVRGLSEFELTFNQDVAYNNPELIYINAYHPLITATKECFKQKLTKSNVAFQFGLNKEHFIDLPQIACGEYFLAIYTICFTRRWFGKEHNNELLIPIIFDVQSNAIIESRDVSDRFLGESQLYATINQIPYKSDSILIDHIRVEMAFNIDKIYNEHLDDQRMRLDTSKALHIQRTEEFYNNRINILEKNLLNLENIVQNTFSEDERTRIQRVLPAQRGLLKSLKEEKEEAIQKINNSEIQTKEPCLLSLSQIRVY
jgi:hypothetical protein